MAVVYRTSGLWGAGLGRNLHAPEIDENFWTLEQRINDLINNPLQPVPIASFSVVGRNFFVNMGDATQFGPFPLPVLTFRDRGTWAPATLYDALDLMLVPGFGLVMAELDHTSDATFDPLRLIGSDLVYKVLIPMVDEVSYDLAFEVTGPLPGDGSVLLQFPVTRAMTIPINAAGSLFFLGTATSAIDQDLPISILRSGTFIPVGRISFQPGVSLNADGQFGLAVGLATATVLEVGDILYVKAPVGADATAANLSANFAILR